MIRKISYSLQQVLMNEIEKYPVNIDFDESSRAWRENKRVLKNGMFSYKKDKKIVVIMTMMEKDVEKKS